MALLSSAVGMEFYEYYLYFTGEKKELIEAGWFKFRMVHLIKLSLQGALHPGITCALRAVRGAGGSFVAWQSPWLSL
jgi:hypothetical protein